jgi:hypothetical protein
MTILMSISEKFGGVSGNVLDSGNTNSLCAELCKVTTFKATGSAVRVVMFGTYRTERLAS